MIKTPMMLLISADDALDEELLKYSVDDIAEMGFDAVCLEFRRSNYDEFDPIGLKAMKVVHDRAKEKGLGFVKIVPHFQACAKEKTPKYQEYILRKYPFLRRKLFKEYSIATGGSSRRINIDALFGSLPSDILAMFSVVRSEKGNILSAKAVTNEIKYKIENDEIFLENCPDGEVLIYPVYETDEVDYSHEKSTLILDEMLNIYKDFALDGYALDEFGVDSRKGDCYLANESFFDKFQMKNGYDLKDELFLLNNCGESHRFGKVRYDYYQLTCDVTANFQMSAKKKFCNMYGNDIFIGFHNTWWGEGNSGDLWTGDIDYFQYANTMSGGFVDAQYDSERTMTSMTLLAESLARYTAEGAAYNMCWDRYVTPDKMDYYHRFLATRNVNWVGHAYGKSAPNRFIRDSFIFDFKSIECLWGDTSRVVKREQIFSEFTGNLSSKAKVAITYNWESNAYYNSDYMHYHRLSFKALTDKLVLNNIPADIVPSYETDFSVYEVIFVLWPVVMNKLQWNAIKEAINAGKKVYFIGPPVRITTEGEDISQEFEDLIGVHTLNKAVYEGSYEYVAWDLWFTNNWIKMMCYQDENRRRDFLKGNVSYYGYEVPLTDTFNNILAELEKYQLIPSNRSIAKAFYGENEQVINITSRWQWKINEKFVFEGRIVEVKNGTLVGIKFTNDDVQVISDGFAEVIVDGVAIDCKII